MKLNRSLFSFVLLVLLQSVPSVGNAQKLSEQEQSIKRPSLIVIGKVSATLDLVRPEKLTGTVRILPSGDRIAELPKPSEYYVGTVYQFRVEELLKGNKTARAGQTITVLVPGLANTSDRVILSPRFRYLLQLSLLNDAEEYQSMMLMDLNHPSAARQQLDPRTTYVILSDPNGAIPVTAENKRLIENIRH